MEVFLLVGLAWGLSYCLKGSEGLPAVLDAMTEYILFLKGY